MNNGSAAQFCAAKERKLYRLCEVAGVRRRMEVVPERHGTGILPVFTISSASDFCVERVKAPEVTVVRLLASVGLLVVLLLCAGSVAAQTLPRPAEFYFDEDRQTTRRFDLLGADQVNESAVQALLRQGARDRRGAESIGRMAHTAFNRGRADIGQALYERALRDTGSSHGSWRNLVWNYAWDLHQAGRADEALAAFVQLITARSTRAAWIPPTLALALWQSNRRDDALRWYAAAVRTEPDLWSAPADFAELLPDWSEQDRQTLQQVHAMWAQNPPAWP